MKKAILSIIAMLTISLAMQAQTKPATAAKSPAATPNKMVAATKPVDKKVSSATTQVKKTTPSKATTSVAAVSPSAPTKKDGTADMRYKANKAKPVTPVKKDGTPDKRYKANKPKN
jgi:hypothetical protein